MDRIDFHTHSTHSDGTLSPEALIRLAVQVGLKAVALTDHDTVSGIPEFLAHGRTQQIEAVPGIEISAWHKNTSMHILGIGFQHDNPGLKRRLVKLQNGRRLRNKGIIAKLKQLGIHITLAELEKTAGDQVGRPHIASLLVKHRVARTVDEAFARFLRDGGAAYVPCIKFQAEDAIDMIRQAGGLSFLAHPGSIDPSLATIPGLLETLIPMGLSGIEVFYPKHSAKATRNLELLAGRFGLLVSGGSDFHGSIRPASPLGGTKKSLRVPYQLWQDMKAHLGYSRRNLEPSTLAARTTKG